MATKSTLDTKRVSLTIPSEILSDIDRLGSLMDISRSALISLLAQRLVPSMLRTLDHCLNEPDLPLDSPSARRATLKTQEFLKNEINGLTAAFDKESAEILRGSKHEH